MTFPPSPRHLAAALPALLAALLLSLPAGAAAIGGGAAVEGAARKGTTSAEPKATLPEIERQVMCVTCKIPLNVAESPQADRERAYIQSLIDEGRSEAQIKQALVGQYGASVLGLPGTSGFDLTVYLVPAAVLLALAAAVALLLPRWRRRAADEQAAEHAPGQGLPVGDAARLESDMARFD